MASLLPLFSVFLAGLLLLIIGAIGYTLLFQSRLPHPTSLMVFLLPASAAFLVGLTLLFLFAGRTIFPRTAAFPTLPAIELRGSATSPAVSSQPGSTPAVSTVPASEPQGKIVFTCQVFRDAERDQICLVNADGSGFRRLTQNDRGDYSFPSLSPNGLNLVYAGKEAGGRVEIYERDLQGNARRLTDSADAAFGPGDSYAPEISPDGSQIVFHRQVDGTNRVWIMARDGSSPHQVFGPPQGYGWDPTWSPDGQEILFASDRSESIQLYRMNLDGTGLRQASNLAGIRGRSDWSPDSSGLATYAGPAWEREIFWMRPDGSGLRQLTDGGNNLAPSFSPDGAWITFTSYRDHSNEVSGCEIYLLRLADGRLVRLTENDTCDWQPRWGP